MTISGNTHEHPIRIYFGDTDAGGVVYHARYLELAERARTETLREAGFPHDEMMAEHGCMFMVRRVNVRYLAPARLDDLLHVVTTRLAETGATITLSQVFLREAEELARLEVELVCVSTANHKPARIPPRWRRILTD